MVYRSGASRSAPVIVRCSSTRVGLPNPSDDGLGSRIGASVVSNSGVRREGQHGGENVLGSAARQIAADRFGQVSGVDGRRALGLGLPIRQCKQCSRRLLPMLGSACLARHAHHHSTDDC